MWPRDKEAGGTEEESRHAGLIGQLAEKISGYLKEQVQTKEDIAINI